MKLSIPGWIRCSKGFSHPPLIWAQANWISQPPLIFLFEGVFPTPPYLGLGDLYFSTRSYFLVRRMCPTPPYVGLGELGFPPPSYFLSEGLSSVQFFSTPRPIHTGTVPLVMVTHHTTFNDPRSEIRGGWEKPFEQKNKGGEKSSSPVPT